MSTGDRTNRVRVRVPATSANLGPGYDSFGLALARYDEVVAEAIPSGVEVHVRGIGAGALPTDESHLVVRAALKTFAALGVPAPGLRLVCTNSIPHGSGQGSSAAAVVSGVLLARALAAGACVESLELDDAGVLRLATELEGHPDNAAPALLGGFTLAWRGEEGNPRAVRLPVHPDLRAIVFTADANCATSTARAALPGSVPHADAAANSAAAALLVHAIGADPSLLFDGTTDRLHQGYRAPVMPQSAALIAELRSHGLAAVLSGAGPSVLVLTTARADHALPPHPGFDAQDVPVDTLGAQVMRC